MAAEPEASTLKRLFPNLSSPKKPRAGTYILSIPRLVSGPCNAQLSYLKAELFLSGTEKKSMRYR